MLLFLSGTAPQPHNASVLTVQLLLMFFMPERMKGCRYNFEKNKIFHEKIYFTGTFPILLSILSSHLHFCSIKLETFDAMFVFMNTVCLCVLEGERIYAHKLSFQGQIVKCNCY